MHLGPDCPVRGLAEHRHGFSIHEPFYCFCLIAIAKKDYTQRYFPGVPPSAALLRSLDLANDYLLKLYHSNQGSLVVTSEVWLFFVK